jgi:hypothetical protein
MANKMVMFELPNVLTTGKVSVLKKKKTGKVSFGRYPFAAECMLHSTVLIEVACVTEPREDPLPGDTGEAETWKMFSEVLMIFR